MKITRCTELKPDGAPHSYNGKLILKPATEREHNSLASFVESGLSSLVEDGVAVSATFPEEGITIWVSATSKNKMDKVLNTIPSKIRCE